MSGDVFNSCPSDKLLVETGLFDFLVAARQKAAPKFSSQIFARLTRSRFEDTVLISLALEQLYTCS